VKRPANIAKAYKNKGIEYSRELFHVPCSNVKFQTWRTIRLIHVIYVRRMGTSTTDRPTDTGGLPTDRLAGRLAGLPAIRRLEEVGLTGICPA
jgi:hypothetical protein